MSSSVQPIQKHTVQVRDGLLSVYQYGSTGTKSALLIHGITSSHLAWQFLAKHLVDAGYVVYAPDLRGRASSNHLPGPFGMKTHAKDMADLITELQLSSPLVIGHSMGGFVAVALNDLYPQLVFKIVLVDGGLPLSIPAGMDLEQLLPLVLGPALARLELTFESKSAYQDYWRAHPAFSAEFPSEMLAYVDHDLVGSEPSLQPSTNKEAVAQDSADLWGSSFIDQALIDLKSPVQLFRAVRGLQNEETPLYPKAPLDAALDRYPMIECITVPDTNHYTILMANSGADAVAAHLKL